MARKKIMSVISNNSLAGLWPINDSSFPLLQYIDPYGNAIFNGVQMSEIRTELKSLIGKASTDEQKAVLGGITELARRCQESSHRVLEIRGD